MKRTETKTYERDTVVEVRCDLCGYAKPEPQMDDWGQKPVNPDYYGKENTQEIKIKAQFGYSYPDGGSFSEQEFDVLPQVLDREAAALVRDSGCSPACNGVRVVSKNRGEAISVGARGGDGLKQVGARIPAELYARTQREAVRGGVTMGIVVQHALSRYLAHAERETKLGRPPEYE